jgi:hypothetical protein
MARRPILIIWQFIASLSRRPKKITTNGKENSKCQRKKDIFPAIQVETYLDINNHKNKSTMCLTDNCNHTLKITNHTTFDFDIEINSFPESNRFAFSQEDGIVIPNWKYKKHVGAALEDENNNIISPREVGDISKIIPTSNNPPFNDQIKSSISVNNYNGVTNWICRGQLCLDIHIE